MSQAVSLVKFKENPKQIRKKKAATILISLTKKPKRTHTETSRFHFQKRFRERVGYRIGDEEYNHIRSLVKTSGRFLYRRENEIGAVYGLQYKGMRMKLVYDAFNDSLITLLSI